MLTVSTCFTEIDTLRDKYSDENDEETPVLQIVGDDSTGVSLNSNETIKMFGDISLNKNEMFTLGISVETFEHILPELVCPYLKKLSEVINGYILITVPNEKGIFFLIKSFYSFVFYCIYLCLF